MQHCFKRFKSLFKSGKVMTSPQSRSPKTLSCNPPFGDKSQRGFKLYSRECLDRHLEGMSVVPLGTIGHGHLRYYFSETKGFFMYEVAPCHRRAFFHDLEHHVTYAGRRSVIKVVAVAPQDNQRGATMMFTLGSVRGATRFFRRYHTSIVIYNTLRKGPARASKLMGQPRSKQHDDIKLWGIKNSRKAPEIKCWAKVTPNLGQEVLLRRKLGAYRFV